MFSQASEYALRALTELARCEQDQYILASHLAESLDVPVHYLAKVLQTLARRGVLKSQRGRQGGFSLAVDPDQITAYDVVHKMDDLHSLESCVMGESTCDDESACPLHDLWADVREQFITSLKGATLADLAEFEDHRPGSSRLSAVRQFMDPRLMKDKKEDKQ